MLRLLMTLVMIAISVPARAADIGVSVSVGEPGFYGRLEIGSFPRPQLIYAEPVVIQPVPVGVVRQPVYLHVPPGHARKWSKHCRKYGACGQPVYFVQQGWYNEVYVPHYHAHRGDERHHVRYQDRHEHRGRGGQHARHDRHGDDKHDKHGRHGKGKDRD